MDFPKLGGAAAPWVWEKSRFMRVICNPPPKKKKRNCTKALVNDVKFFAVLVFDWVKEKAESGCNSWRQEQLGIRDDSLFNQLELLKKMPRPLCIFLPPLHLSQIINVRFWTGTAFVKATLSFLQVSASWPPSSQFIVATQHLEDQFMGPCQRPEASRL